jgi:PadR family transcriptional regulator, regulatory protein PadR
MTIGEIREPSFLVLAALADGDKHGYALIREAEQLSGGRVRLKVGTLYAALDRLGEQGLVAVAGEEIVDGRLRRYFHLTEQGMETLHAQAERMRSTADQALNRLRGRLAPAVAR